MKRNFPQPELSIVAQIDWARLAAYIDGEGCICIAAQVHSKPHQGRGRYDYIKITVTGTDARLAAWLLKNFGGNVQWRDTNAKHNRWKPCFSWNVGSGRAAEVLRACQAYFIIKGRQAEVALAFQATMCRSGLRGTPDHVLAYRDELKVEMHALNARGPRANSPETVN